MLSEGQDLVYFCRSSSCLLHEEVILGAQVESRAMWLSGEKSVLSRGNRQCKGPEAGVFGVLEEQQRGEAENKAEWWPEPEW